MTRLPIKYQEGGRLWQGSCAYVLVDPIQTLPRLISHRLEKLSRLTHSSIHVRVIVLRGFDGHIDSLSFDDLGPSDGSLFKSTLLPPHRLV